MFITKFHDRLPTLARSKVVDKSSYDSLSVLDKDFETLGNSDLYVAPGVVFTAQGHGWRTTPRATD